MANIIILQDNVWGKQLSKRLSLNKTQGYGGVQVSVTKKPIFSILKVTRA